MERPYPCCACCPKVTSCPWTPASGSTKLPASSIKTSDSGHKRPVTEQERTLILSRHAAGEESRLIARDLGLRVAQVGAVIAWTHPSLLAKMSKETCASAYRKYLK